MESDDAGLLSQSSLYIFSITFAYTQEFLPLTPTCPVRTVTFDPIGSVHDRRHTSRVGEAGKRGDSND